MVCVCEEDFGQAFYSDFKLRNYLGYWASAWFPVLVVAALLFLEKNVVVAILGPKAGIRAGNERLRAVQRLHT